MITNRTGDIFKSKCKTDAINHARDEFPNESCGAIINDEYVRFENRAEDKTKNFLIQDDLFDQAYIDGQVQCVIHSHIDYPMASYNDQVQQLELDIPFGIINFNKNQMLTHFVFWGDQLPIEPLEGRHFFYGVWDCYALARDYVRMNLNVLPVNPPRRWVFWYRGESEFEKHIQEKLFPFDYIDLEEVKAGDFLLYNINGTKYLNHIGVMLENGYALHHFSDEISRKVPVTVYRDFLNRACRFNPEWDRWEEFKASWRRIHD